MSEPAQFSVIYLRLMMKSGLLGETTRGSQFDLTQAHVSESEMVDWTLGAQLLETLASHASSTAWPALLGQHFGISTHGPLGFAAISAPDVGTSFRFLVDYLDVRVTTVNLRFRQQDSLISLQLGDRTGDRRFFQQTSVMILKVLESLALAQRGHADPDEIQFGISQPEPPDVADWLDTFEGRINFGSRLNSISVPASWQRQKSLLYDEDLYQTNKRKCAEIIARRTAAQSTTIRVQQHLKAHFGRCLDHRPAIAPVPDLKTIAAELNLTPRTLIRRLKGDNLQFKQLIRLFRCETGKTLLQNSGLNVAQISERLGYSEPANFTRAFKRWTGHSPAAWRNDYFSGTPERSNK